MKLKDYLYATGQTVPEFSRKHKIDLTTLRTTIRGYRVGEKTAYKIREATEGLVTFDELRHGMIQRKKPRT